jgi:hypothetical protein
MLENSFVILVVDPLTAFVESRAAVTLCPV